MAYLGLICCFFIKEKPLDGCTFTEARGLSLFNIRMEVLKCFFITGTVPQQSSPPSSADHIRSTSSLQNHLRYYSVNSVSEAVPAQHHQPAVLRT